MDTPSSVLQALRRESLDIYNRLHSIQEDASFVEHVHTFYPNIPLVPNLRCGAWYADPTIASSIPAYFKSTDGHTNHWGFNLRRPNLHLLPLIAEHRSIVLVDSTRAGKRIPDALSKTVPIWCAVINRAVARRYPGPDKGIWDTALYTPAGVVSPQEHHQIELRIDAWAESLFNSSFELPDLPVPLRPFWITPATTFPAIQACSTPFFLPIICLSASRQSQDERRPRGFAYIQGSGDDHELWSMGLTPAHYWRHTSALLAATRSELPSLIQTIISSDTVARIDKLYFIDDDRVSKIAKVKGRLRIGTFDDVERGGWNEDLAYVFLPGSPSAATAPPALEQKRSITVSLAPRIKTHLAQTLLPQVLPFIGAELVRGGTVCIICGGKDTGEVGDEGVAVLLAALVVFFNADGEPTVAITTGSQEKGVALPDEGSSSDADDIAETNNLHKIRIPDGINKTSIRTRLEWIIASRPAVNPARATLKRLNEFLLSGERR